MKLDKKNWQKVKFGDVVTYKKITVDPESSGLERYIAGEHMNTEDLHLRKWGTVGDGYLGPAFHSKFEKGDILYGSRRTYLKKVALAEFDGITSNTTFVLKENTDRVVPGLLPFMMLSDAFTENSVKNSKGSVNPYINFKDIGKFEFLLPPLEQQAKLAELLWAGDELTNKYDKLVKQLDNLRKVIFTTAEKESLKYVKLEKLGVISYGMGVPPKTRPDGVPVIRATNIHFGEIFEKDLIRVRPEDVSPGKRVLLETGDIIVVRSGAYTGDVGYINQKWEGSLVGYDLVFKPNRKQIVPLFLREILISDKVQEYFKSESTRSAQPHLNSEQLKCTLIPYPNYKTQLKLGAEIEEILKKRKSTDTLLESFKQIQKQLINQIF